MGRSPLWFPLADLRRGWLGRGEKSWEAIMSSITRTRFIALVAAIDSVACGRCRLGPDRQDGGPNIPDRRRRAGLRCSRQAGRGVDGPRHQQGLAARALQQRRAGWPQDRSRGLRRVRRRHQAGHRATQQGAEGTGRPDRRVRLLRDLRRHRPCGRGTQGADPVHRVRHAPGLRGTRPGAEVSLPGDQQWYGQQRERRVCTSPPSTRTRSKADTSA